jgi:hypothetical protein
VIVKRQVVLALDRYPRNSLKNLPAILRMLDSLLDLEDQPFALPVSPVPEAAVFKGAQSNGYNKLLKFIREVLPDVRHGSLSA